MPFFLGNRPLRLKFLKGNSGNYCNNPLFQENTKFYFGNVKQRFCNSIPVFWLSRVLFNPPQVVTIRFSRGLTLSSIWLSICFSIIKFTTHGMFDTLCFAEIATACLNQDRRYLSWGDNMTSLITSIICLPLHYLTMSSWRSQLPNLQSRLLHFWDYFCFFRRKWEKENSDYLLRGRSFRDGTFILFFHCCSVFS